MAIAFVKLILLPVIPYQITAMLPHLTEEADIRNAFSRMDHNDDGVVDLTDFLMWEERMQEGRANTDYYALQEVSPNAISEIFYRVITTAE